MAFLQKIHAGQPLNIPAQDYNSFIDTTRFFRKHENDFESLFRERFHEKFPDTAVIRVKNESGRTIARFGVLELTAPLTHPNEDLTRFQNKIIMRGGVPTGRELGKFVIILAPSADNDVLLRAVNDGNCICRLKVTQAGLDELDGRQERADAEAGNTDSLVLHPEGSALVLWRELQDETPSTGVQWAVVKLGLPCCGDALSTTGTGTDTVTSDTGTGDGTGDATGDGTGDATGDATGDGTGDDGTADGTGGTTGTTTGTGSTTTEGPVCECVYEWKEPGAWSLLPSDCGSPLCPDTSSCLSEPFNPPINPVFGQIHREDCPETGPPGP